VDPWIPDAGIAGWCEAMTCLMKASLLYRK